MICDDYRMFIMLTELLDIIEYKLEVEKYCPYYNNSLMQGKKYYDSFIRATQEINIPRNTAGCKPLSDSKTDKDLIAKQIRYGLMGLKTLYILVNLD